MKTSIDTTTPQATKENYEVAKFLLTKFFVLIGNGFHPESHFGDYVDREDRPLFTDEEVVELEKERAFVNYFYENSLNNLYEDLRLVSVYTDMVMIVTDPRDGISTETELSIGDIATPDSTADYSRQCGYLVTFEFRSEKL